MRPKFGSWQKQHSGANYSAAMPSRLAKHNLRIVLTHISQHSEKKNLHPQYPMTRLIGTRPPAQFRIRNPVNRSSFRSDIFDVVCPLCDSEQRSRPLWLLFILRTTFRGGQRIALFLLVLAIVGCTVSPTPAATQGPAGPPGQTGQSRQQGDPGQSGDTGETGDRGQTGQSGNPGRDGRAAPCPAGEHRYTNPDTGRVRR